MASGQLILLLRRKKAIRKDATAGKVEKNISIFYINSFKIKFQSLLFLLRLSRTIFNSKRTHTTRKIDWF